MATPREDRPYSQFNFQVSWDSLAADSPKAGFQEVAGLGMEIAVAEYRGGNSQTNEPIKVTGTVKTPDVTLKRGLIGTEELYEWLEQVRNGDQDALKSVTIQLMSENREDVAMTWKLTNARPMKYTGPSLNGKGTDLAIEELVLAAERIDFE